MKLMEISEIDFPRRVRVCRPAGSYDESGRYVESETEVIAQMIADIQFSLKVRKLVSVNGTGVSDSAAWVMYCIPPATVLAGDRVYAGAEEFEVEAVGEWGSHTECVMKKK
jgi:hypothetical protein